MRQYLLAFLLLFSGFAARADTISSFTFQGASVTYGLAGDHNVVAGTFTVDTSTGVVQSVSFTAANVFSSGVYAQAGPEVYVGSLQNALSFSAASLINYQGSTFNLRTPDDLYVGSTNLTPSGSADPPVVPEPSSLLLLGTSLIGIVGILRRRANTRQAFLS